MDFLRPWACQILWCSVPLSQTHKTEFNSKLFSCCSHISAFYVSCHRVLWNDADLSAALYFFFYKEFSVRSFAAPTPVTCTAAGYCYGLWPWETCTNFASLSSCFLKVLIDEVRCLIGNVKFLDSCQPVRSIYVVFFPSGPLGSSNTGLCAAVSGGVNISRWEKMAAKNSVKI